MTKRKARVLYVAEYEGSMRHPISARVFIFPTERAAEESVHRGGCDSYSKFIEVLPRKRKQKRVRK